MGRTKFLVAALAVVILAAGAYVYATGEKAIPKGIVPSSDVTAEVGERFVEPSQALAFGDELGFFNAEAQVGDNQCVGVGWDGSYIWVTGAGYNLGGVNYLYRFGLDGIYQVRFPQLTTSYWGWRDMCFEEDDSNPGPIKGYLWASETNRIDEVNPNTGAKTGRSIPSPINPARAEAWEPPDAAGVEGYIWTGSFTGSIYRVNISTGTSQGPYSGLGLTKYGAAWDDCPGADPAIWWTHQNDNLLREYDPITKTLTGTTITRSWGYASGGVSWGKDVEFFGDPTLGVLLNLWQGSPQDMVYAYELCIAVAYDNDMAVSMIDEPGGTVSSDFAPVVTVKNQGNNDQTGVTVRVTIDDKSATEVYNEVMTTGTLAKFETETLTFPTFAISACEQYTIEACTELVGDENPPNDCKSMGTLVMDYYNDFEAVGCFTPYGSWEWGTPTYGPPGAYSGVNCWGTVLAGSYSPNACDTLVGSFIALGDSPSLLYYHWFNIETTFDGYNVYMSVNGGPYELIDPVGGYPGTSPYANCISGDPTFAGSSGWALVTFELTTVMAGDEVKIKWTLGTDSSVQYPGVYIDDLGGNCLELAPPKVDLDVDDDYANLVANTMTLYAPRSTTSFVSYAFGTFVVVNPDETNNVDYWDGPGEAEITSIDYASTDLATFHKPDDPIPGGNVSFAGPASLGSGEAALVALSVEMPEQIEYGENDHESKVYRGTVTVEGGSVTPCGSATASDEFALKVKGVHSTGTTSSLVGEWGDKGITFSWGNFDFAESFNLYRADGNGNFGKLNSAPMPDNSSYTDSDVVKARTYEYKFGIVLSNGEERVFGPMTAVYARRPASASLMPSVPNPMNAETVIRYNLAKDDAVTLKVYDLTGALVKTLVSEPKMAGYHSVIWDATNEAGKGVANGVYFYRLTTGEFSQSRKIVVMR